MDYSDRTNTESDGLTLRSITSGESWTIPESFRASIAVLGLNCWLILKLIQINIVSIICIYLIQVP